MTYHCLCLKPPQTVPEYAGDVLVVYATPDNAPMPWTPAELNAFITTELPGRADVAALGDAFLLLQYDDVIAFLDERVAAGQVPLLSYPFQISEEYVYDANGDSVFDTNGDHVTKLMTSLGREVA